MKYLLELSLRRGHGRRPSPMNPLIALAALAALVLGCSGSTPDSVDVKAVNDGYDEPTPLRSKQSLVVGDVLVREGKARDDGADTSLCVRATSSDPSVVRARPLRDRDCSVFLLEAKSVGRASVSFAARGRTTTTEIEVTPTEPSSEKE